MAGGHDGPVTEGQTSLHARKRCSSLPSGQQMNQGVPLAHSLACFAKQRTSGLRRRDKRRPGSVLPGASSSQGPAHKRAKRRR